MNTIRTILSTLLFMSIVAGFSQVKVFRLENELNFDGIVEDSEWEGNTPLELTLHMPVFKGTPTEETVVYLGYDDDYLYMVGHMYYKDVSQMRSTSKKRDALEPTTSYFGLILDTFLDKENAMAFFTTPDGLRFDALVFNDAQGDLPMNLSWNTFWDVKTTQHERGYDAEIRIPFSSLRFQDNNGKVVMGMTMYRYISSKNEISSWPAIQNDLGDWGLWKPSRMIEIEFDGLESTRAAYIAPYILGGLQSSYSLNDSETGYNKSSDPRMTAGLDLKYSLSSNFTMDVTVNPDFAQVEADDQQVNLTRFSLFFPEKRLFFQERSSLFDFQLGGPNNLFYSRQIGLSDGNSVPIYGGVRMVGRAGTWDVGMLDMQTHSTEDAESTNFGVFRVKKRAFNPFSYVGGMVTNKISANHYNTAVGVDGVFRITEDDYLAFNYAQTFTDGIDSKPFSLTNAKLRLNAERRIIKGFGYDMTFNAVGEDYNPEMGFELREDYFMSWNNFWWGWLPGEESKFFNHQIRLEAVDFAKNETRKAESAWVALEWRSQAKNNAVYSLKPTYRVENLTENFELSDDAVIPVGRYEFNFAEIMLSSSFSRPVTLMVMGTLGQFFDGNQVVLSLSPQWKVNSSLDFNIDFLYNDVRFPTRDEQFKAVVTRLKSNFNINTKLSLAAFIQHNSSTDQVTSNIRFRFNPKEGNDLFIVFNKGNYLHRTLYDPQLPAYDQQALVVKYTYTFVASR